MNFQTQFENLKKLNLTQSEFVIVGSGALAVRGIREALDIDVVVTELLWTELVTKYPIKRNSFEAETLVLENDIEILNPVHSLYGNGEIVPLKEIFEEADIFDDCKFISLEHLKLIKAHLGREKDLEDIKRIDEYLAS